MRAETLLPLGKLDPGLAQPQSPLELATVPSEAGQADELGYHALLMEETKDDPFAVLALAAQATQSVHLGTSVAIAFARSPFVTAMSAWTLQKMSNGRFELGLGSQVSAHIRRRFGMQAHPAGPWMRDYVRAVRAIWRSWQEQSPLEFASEHYRLDLTVPLFTPAPITHPHIPIQVAAVNPYMCGVAAEVADGVRLHPVCSRRYIVDEVHPAIAAKRDMKGDTKAAPFDICLKPLIASGPDAATLAKRMEVARQRLAFYVSTPAYRLPFDNAGLGDLARAMSQLSRARKWQQMAALVDDDVLHEWVVVAKYDDLADALIERYGGILHRLEISIPVATAHDQDVLSAIVRQLHSAD
ncbi:MAG: TIGR03617 family F420-dependent LLM class oxidoreductase [Gammaproteobacteria bacterium]|nr:TIGR03617 family F420-dependent LLM class oxidoreductase [Gammaproteobacteria bacterium]